jgi:hypothetical protein
MGTQESLKIMTTTTVVKIVAGMTVVSDCQKKLIKIVTAMTVYSDRHCNDSWFRSAR